MPQRKLSTPSVSCDVVEVLFECSQFRLCHGLALMKPVHQALLLTQCLHNQCCTGWLFAILGVVCSVFWYVYGDVTEKKGGWGEGEVGMGVTLPAKGWP